MLQLTSSSAPRSGLQGRLQMLIGAVTIVVGAAVIALAGASSALAVTPTAPPPVTILSSSPFAGFGGDFFITPTGDASTYANGPEILDSHGNVVWFHAIPAGQTASDFRVQSYRRPAGADLVAGNGARRPLQRHRLHLQRTFPADRHRQRRQRPQRRRSRVPDNAMEHGADPLLHHRHREPDLDRRTGSTRP